MTSQDPELAWHYTSSRGLLGILQNQVVWAGSALFMNDFNELLSGSTKLRDFVRERRQSIDDEEGLWLDQMFNFPEGLREDRFILSGSERGDSLTHWRYYGSHQGSYAIGFDRGVPLVPLDQHPGERNPHAPANYYDGLNGPEGAEYAVNPDEIMIETDAWSEVEYDEDQQQAIIEKVFDSYHKNYLARRETRSAIPIQFAPLVDKIKDAGFKDEAELRVLVTVFGPKWKFVSYRATSLGITPYIELTTAPNAAADHAVKATYLPIRHVRVGPSRFGEQVQRTIQDLLEKTGYHDVEVSLSEIPFR